MKRWFREITEKAIRRAAFPSVNALEKAIEEFVQAWNSDPKPFQLTVQAAPIIEKVRRARAALPPSSPRRPRRKNRNIFKSRTTRIFTFPIFFPLGA